MIAWWMSILYLSFSPRAGESWEVLWITGRRRFHLRRDDRFQNGTVYADRKLNADDVVFTFQRIFDRRHPWHSTSTAVALL